jgi:hypothetical protein
MNKLKLHLLDEVMSPDHHLLCQACHPAVILQAPMLFFFYQVIHAFYSKQLRLQTDGIV